MVFLSIASILGFVAALRYLSGRHFGVLIFVTTCAAGSILYLFALVNLLLVAAWLLLVGGLVAGAWTLIAAHRTGRLHELRFLVSPALVVLLLSCAVYYWQMHDSYYLSSDEYYNWGKLTKYLTTSSELPEAGVGPVQMRTYAPGAGLFQYLMIHPGSFTEGKTRLAQFFLLLAGLMVLWDGVPWRRVHRGLLPFLAGIGILLLFGHRLDLLQVEGVLATHLAALLLMTRRVELDRWTLLWFVPPIFFLPLIKNAGIALSLTASAAVLGKLVFDQFFERRTVRRGSRWLLAATLLLVVFAGPLAAHSWRAHCDALGLRIQIGISDIPRDRVRRAFSPRAIEVHQEIIAKVLTQGFTDEPLNEVAPPVWAQHRLRRHRMLDLLSLLRLDLRSWCLLLAGLGLLCIHLSPDRRDRWTIGCAVASVFAFLVPYLFALLLAYLFRIQPPLISFARYVNAIVGAGALYLVACLIDLLPGSAVLQPCRLHPPRPPRSLRHPWRLFRERWFREGTGSLAAAFVVGFLFLLIWNIHGMRILSEHPGKLPTRAELEEGAELVRSVVPEDARIYLVSHGDEHRQNIFRFQVMSYLLVPWPTNHSNFTIHRRGGQGNTAIRPLMSPKEWTETLTRGGYDYVYLVHVDERFWRIFGDLFAPGTGPRDAFFRVTSLPDGTIELRPAPDSV